jgi:hypothetical protein
MRSPWTDEQVELLIKHYPDMPMSALIETIGRKMHSIYNKAYSMGLKRSEEYLASEHACRLRRDFTEASMACRFKKGQEPVNKGIKGVYHPGSVATFFPKGHKPDNYKPVGTIREIEDGYFEMKMAEGMRKWRLLQRVIWERCNRPIPNNHVVIFLDGNKKNLEITNLAVLSRSDNMKRNSYHQNYPKDIQLLIQLKGALNRQINRRENHGQRTA